MLLSRHASLASAFAASAFLFSASAEAATYVTQVTGSASGAFSYSRVEITWSTTVPVGEAVDFTDLRELRFSIYDSGNTLVFTDLMISEGEIQRIGGVERSREAIWFAGVSGVSGVSISEFDNDMDSVQLGRATGTTFIIASYDPESIDLVYHINGVRQEYVPFSAASWNTSAIPEPSACAAFAGMLGLTLLLRRRA